MAFNGLMQVHDDASVDTDKLSYEIFSILESKFLFGYDNSKSKLLIPQQVPVRIEKKPDDYMSSTSSTRTDDSSSPTSVSEGEPRWRIRILSIDGGGCSSLRGVLPCRALAHLESAIKETSNDPNATIADYFDIVTGTGVGGVVAAMLFATRDGALPVFGAEEAWRLLVERGKFIFNPGGGGFLRQLFGGGGGGLEKFLKETFGGGDRALTLKDTLKPVLIPCYDLTTSAPFLFSTADATESDGYNFRLSEVCRATVAEPGLLEPVLMRSVDGKNQCVGLDGGLAMSNPTAAAITHVLHNRKDFPHVNGVDDLLVLSLGTGQVTEAGTGLQYDIVKGWKARDWVRPVVRIAADGSADFADQAVALAFGPRRFANYVRITANGSNIEADHSCPRKAKKLTDTANQLLQQKNVESVIFGGKKISEMTNMEKLDKFAAELVMEQRRRRRSCDTDTNCAAAPA